MAILNQKGCPMVHLVIVVNKNFMYAKNQGPDSREGPILREARFPKPVRTSQFFWGLGNSGSPGTSKNRAVLQNRPVLLRPGELGFPRNQWEPAGYWGPWQSQIPWEPMRARELESSRIIYREGVDWRYKKMIGDEVEGSEAQKKQPVHCFLIPNGCHSKGSEWGN